MFIAFMISYILQPEYIGQAEESLLNSWYHDELNQMIFGLFAVIVLILYIVSWGLMYFFIRGGNIVYIVALVLGYLAYLFPAGPSIYTNMSEVFLSLGLLTQGAILALLFLSPIKDKFKKNRKDQVNIISKN